MQGVRVGHVGSGWRAVGGRLQPIQPGRARLAHWRGDLPPRPTILGAAFDAVLFDVDGTLIDSTPAVERSWLQ